MTQYSEGKYKEKGWNNITVAKVQYINEAISENKNKIIIFTDIDCQFFNLSKKILTYERRDKDILFQNNGNDFNSGFIP